MGNSAADLKRSYQSRYREKLKKERPWMLNWIALRSRCVSPSCRYFSRGTKNLITKEQVESLWFRDKAYLMEVPSIDRIDNNGDYHVDNCRFIERNYNASLGAPNKVKVCRINRDGTRTIFDSVLQAARAMGHRRSCNIISVADGETRTAYGYKWEYVDREHFIKRSNRTNRALNEGTTK
jgi:hypothetical protein